MENILEMVAKAIQNGDPKGIVRTGIKAGKKPGEKINDLIDKVFDTLEGKSNISNS